MRSVYTFLTILLVTLMFSNGMCQDRIPADRLLLLIAGPSGDRIHPDEQSIISFLNDLRGEHRLSELKLGTMHFDRTQEFQMLEQALGIYESSGITVALVELSSRGEPLRTFSQFTGVNSSNIHGGHKELLTLWSDISGQSIPPSLRVAAEVTPAPVRTPEPSPEPPVNNPDTGLPHPMAGDHIYSFEGIRSVVTQLDQNTNSVWSTLRNQPLRSDGLDAPLRRATVHLLSAVVDLKYAHFDGIIYPIAQLESVRSAGIQWRLANPRAYVSSGLQDQVISILNLLRQAEEIEAQGKGN